MAYVYRHFIPENTAPKGTKSIGVYDKNGAKLHEIPLGRLTPPTTEKLYSFGLVSDIHLWVTEPTWEGNKKFDNALTYFEECGCAMCVIAGDLTQTGFYRRTVESDASTTYLDEQQFKNYKEICDKHTIPVYELCGNHESYYIPMSDCFELLYTYTGKNALSYTVTQGNDLFVLCGQNNGSSVMSDEDFTWLGETLEANKDKRCFVFVHSYIEEDSGDPADLRENSIFETWSKKANFIALMQKYSNVILFHGHSHTKFQYQALDKNANYTERNGFRSVHVPSLGTPRDLDLEAGKTVDDPNASQGYIVDVYNDCIVLNGWDFVGNKSVPLGTYKIEI